MSRLVVFNWKQNLVMPEAKELLTKMQTLKTQTNKVVVCPPFIHMAMAQQLLPLNVMLGSQDVSLYGSGAYTGEVSSKMLSSYGVRYALVGHSERRNHFKETSEILIQKIHRLIEEGITPIFCVGESEEVRKNNQHLNFLKNQVLDVLKALKSEVSLVVAYEPIWAIGSSNVAKSSDVLEVSTELRKFIKQWSPSQNVPILYGGSVTSSNALEMLESGAVDGLLVGGASLKIDEVFRLALV